MEDNELVRVQDLYLYFNETASFFSNHRYINKAVDNISLSIKKGETVSIVGESGSGKTTLAKTILGLYKPTKGKIFYSGEEITRMRIGQYSRKIQMVFQESYSSLNPMMRIEATIKEPMQINKIGNKESWNGRVVELINDMGLSADILDKYPHELSGGQRQRVGIARALSVEPEFLICDEPLSAIDVINRTRIINFFRSLQKEKGVTYLFIAHDLKFVKVLSHWIGIMYKGKMVEFGTTDEIYNNPKHAYTKKLLLASTNKFSRLL